MVHAITASGTRLVVVVLLVGPLAGCLDETDTPQPPDAAIDAEPAAEGSVPVVREPTPPPSAPLRFPLDAPVDRRQTINGSFAPEETGLGGGFVTGAFTAHVDLTGLVPPDVPTRIQLTVTLDAAHIPVVGPSARADPFDNGTVWYALDWQNPAAGRYEMSGIVKRSAQGTLGVALEAYAPESGDPPEVDYVVDVTVTARPEAIPIGVPVALTRAANDTVTFETEPENQAELLIFAADDRLLERLFFVTSERWSVPRGAGGELVVVPILGAGDLRILGRSSSDENAPTLRALGLTRETGAPHELPLMGTTTWDFDVATRPLRALVTVLGPAGEPWTCVGSLDVVMRAPSGPVLHAASDCPSPTNVPFLYEERRTWTTPTGDARLAPGTYSVAVDNTLWSGHAAFHALEWYAR